IVSEAQAILDPLLGGITLGIGNGLKALLCAIEAGFSDFGSDFDSATDRANSQTADRSSRGQSAHRLPPPIIIFLPKSDKK
ncbi:hypothetical protein TNCV_2129041, partial [Trichonephila clavipes]